MHPAKMKSIVAGSAETRTAYLVRKVTDFEQVWGLNNDGWAACTDDSGQPALPIWPEAELAALCAVGEWAEMAPKAIELAEFMERWLPGLERDGRLVAVFPTTRGQGVFMSPSALAEKLQEELAQYE